LAGLDALQSESLLRALGDRHPGVREHAIKLAERLLEPSPSGRGSLPPDIHEKLLSLADDEDLRVRYQLAFTLGELKDPARLEALAKLARRDAGDRWMRLAIESSLSEGAGQVFAELAADAAFRGSPPAGCFWPTWRGRPARRIASRKSRPCSRRWAAFRARNKPPRRPSSAG
jgi:hypothetical protein